MIVGLGLDVVEVDRIERALEKFGDRFLGRVLTDLERDQMRGNPVRYVAVRFAAKEAASKALGTGFSNGVFFGNIEIRRQESGKPELFFLGEAQDVFRSLGAARALISLTHGRDTAAAVVVLDSEAGS
ncbi:holo-[acyl-carrier-protein] synthase [Desulfocurvus sp. DL9XJH121]